MMMLSGKRGYIPWLLALGWGLLILVLSLMPGGPGHIMFGIPHFDKVGHCGMYAVWTVLIVRALMTMPGYTAQRSLRVAIGVGTLAGIGLEFGQLFMHQGRSFEVADMVANAVGAMAGAWVGLKSLDWRRKRD